MCILFEEKNMKHFWCIVQKCSAESCFRASIKNVVFHRTYPQHRECGSVLPWGKNLKRVDISITESLYSALSINTTLKPTRLQYKGNVIFISSVSSYKIPVYSLATHKLAFSVSQMKSNNCSLTVVYTNWFTFVDPVLYLFFLPYLSQIYHQEGFSRQIEPKI